MVLSEAILISAYFLGLRRAYRLVLKTERKVLRRVPRIQQFAERNIKHVFRLAQRGIKEVEQRDLAFGKYLGGLVDKMPSWDFFKDRSITRGEKYRALKASLRATVESRRARRAAESGGASAGEAMKIVRDQEKAKWEGQAPGRVIEEKVREEGAVGEWRGLPNEGAKVVASRRAGDEDSSKISDASRKGSPKGSLRDRTSAGETPWGEPARGEVGKASPSGVYAARKYHSARGLDVLSQERWPETSVLTRGRGAADRFVQDQGTMEESMPADERRGSSSGARAFGEGLLRAAFESSKDGSAGVVVRDVVSAGQVEDTSSSSVLTGTGSWKSVRCQRALSPGFELKNSIRKARSQFSSQT
ncbi:hypothetical protein KFL_000050550 [Klebsormidium nitens]|uniref:Uncharacterized protein n=1 Tax=Klebsormidium nitens TaxID=105231 RepID=A0A1Y1HL87_KLENI|nr:hypothetical protein KFL_000050550 [Klebsormidium nitens]|eukprot:GAQ77919.1 hypothetical protein KFL_000050550 [Klebsormidium nitens]